MAEVTTKTGLLRHIASGKHRFPKRNMVDTAAIMVSGSDGMLRVGNRLNRSEDYGDINVVDGSGAGISEGNCWFCSGCSLKPERLTGKKMHEELRQELIRMFNDGESTGGTRKKGKQKYTSEEAMTELRGMKLSSGLLKFSSTSPYGKLLSASQISSFWSRYKTMNTAMNVKTNTEGLADIPEESVLNEWVDSDLLDNESDGIISRPDKTGRGKPEVASMQHGDKLKQVSGNEPAPANKNVPLAKSSSSAAFSLACIATAGREVNGTSATGCFNMLKPGLHGAVNEKILAGKTFVIAGYFPEVGGGDSTAPGVANIKIMIESFGGKANTSFSKKSNFLLVGKDSAPKKFKASEERGLVVVTLCRLQLLLMGQTSFEALENMPAVTSADVQGSRYQPAGILPLKAGSKKASEIMPTVTSAVDQASAYERADIMHLKTVAQESSVSMALTKQGQQAGFDANLGK